MTLTKEQILEQANDLLDEGNIFYPYHPDHWYEAITQTEAPENINIAQRFSYAASAECNEKSFNRDAVVALCEYVENYWLEKYAIPYIRKALENV